MQVQYKQSLVVVLTLDEVEVAWLNAVMQNPLTPTAELESPQDRQLRERFFTATTRPQS